MELVCINCPRGCKLSVEKAKDEIKVSGNFCPRGEQYAISEMTNPLRTLTTTIKISSNKYDRLPVISSKPFPKDKVIDVVKSLKNIEVKAPININEIIVENVLGLGVDIISSKTINE